MLGRDCVGIGGGLLVDNEECKRAAASLGIQFDGIQEYSSWPKGCYACKGCLVADSAFWNNHSRGTKNDKAQQICSRKGKTLIVKIPNEQGVFSSCNTN